MQLHVVQALYPIQSIVTDAHNQLYEEGHETFHHTPIINLMVQHNFLWTKYSAKVARLSNVVELQRW